MPQIQNSVLMSFVSSAVRCVTTVRSCECAALCITVHWMGKCDVADGTDTRDAAQRLNVCCNFIVVLVQRADREGAKPEANPSGANAMHMESGDMQQQKRNMRKVSNPGKFLRPKFHIPVHGIRRRWCPCRRRPLWTNRLNGSERDRLMAIQSPKKFN